MGKLAVSITRGRGEGSEASPAAERPPIVAKGGRRSAEIVRHQGASTAHYKKMYDRSSELARIGVWECDLASEHLTWTDGVYDLFELPRGSRVDRAVSLRFYEEDSRIALERLRSAAIRDGSGFSLDIRIRTARGNRRWLRLTADVELEEGRAARLFGTKQDITAEKEAQEQVRLLQAELLHASQGHAMDTMAETLAHELNQPLTAAHNYIAASARSLSRAGSADTAVALEGLQLARAAVLRAGDTIRSIRSMTQGKPVQRESCSLRSICESTMAIVGRESTPQMTIDIADDADVVVVNKVQIERVLMSLLNDADEARSDAGPTRVDLSARRAGDFVEIRVSDAGATRSASDSPSIGSRVGLAICRTIVERHGGRIWIDDVPAGASIRFTLPVIRPGAD